MATGANGSGNLRMYGVLVRHFRELRGVTRVELGKDVGYSDSMITKIERGERTPSDAFIESAEKVLVAQGALKAASEELSRGSDEFPDWFGPFAEEEKKCVSLHSYENHVVPGLLQTEDYARGVFAGHCPALDDEDIERRVNARLDRQTLFGRKPAPIVSYVLEEVVLRRPFGGRQALKGQLYRILEIGRLRNVEIQVMPTNRETHVGTDGPMVLLETESRQTFGYIESQDDPWYVSDPRKVSVLQARYGILRAQALAPEESMRLVERLTEDL
ncbi:helix-turn-helix domain-containing protein [Streptomyces sp. 6N223]|uniref:helix-turn-helix domain-containing protein n=1 Tax=Streptomyces sp. 6N223 TaxID=3457412 RepID=UPI003FCF79A7